MQQLVLATLQLYWDCILKASKGLLLNWTLIVGSLGAYILFNTSLFFFSRPPLSYLGIAGGFLLGFLHIALIALYYIWIAETIQKQRLKIKSLVQFDMQMFFQVISAAFILWIAGWLVSAVDQSIEGEKLMPFFTLGIVIIFNALPEVIYFHRSEGMQALMHAATFTRENWIEWFIPLLLLLLPTLLISYEVTLAIIASSEELLPATAVFRAWDIGAGAIGLSNNWMVKLFSALVCLIIANWYMLFRGFLFEELESGTRRQRMYRSKMGV